MSKTKVLLAMGIILLFIGLSFSPATAKIPDTEFTQKELKKIENLMPELMEEMAKATSCAELIKTLTSFMKDYENYPIIAFVLKIIREVIDLMKKVNDLRPLKTSTFIMSWDFANKYNRIFANKHNRIFDREKDNMKDAFLQLLENRPLQKARFNIRWTIANRCLEKWESANRIDLFNKGNKIQLYRPLATWYYSGKSSNQILNSRTIIIDFYPFNVKMLTGRQFGFMRNFEGLYFYRDNTLKDRTFNCFIGKTAAVRGFELPIFNIFSANK